MSYFDETIIFRVREEFLEKIVQICEKFPEKFDNPSHFCRVAIMRLVKEHILIEKKNLEVVKDE